MTPDDLKDIRPPVDLPPEYFWLVVFAAVLLIALATFSFYWLRARLSKKMSPVVSPPAWEIALLELEQLKKDDLPSHGRIQEYYVRLSSIIRHYLERRFNVNAPEMTTDEFLIHMKTMPVLEQKQKEALKEFLTLSDMVKFARYSSTVAEIEEALSVAQKLVKDTTPVVTQTL